MVTPQPLFDDISSIFDNTHGISLFPVGESLGLWLALRATCRASLIWSSNAYGVETARILKDRMIRFGATPVNQLTLRRLGCICGLCYAPDLVDDWICPARFYRRRLHDWLPW